MSSRPSALSASSSFRDALRCSAAAMQSVSRLSRVSMLRAAPLLSAMRHNRAAHADARGSAAIWTRRQARAGGCGR